MPIISLSNASDTASSWYQVVVPGLEKGLTTKGENTKGEQQIKCEPITPQPTKRNERVFVIPLTPRLSVCQIPACRC